MFQAIISMEKMMMRLPQALAREYQRVYFELTALKFNENGKKLVLQDCHIEMVREWIEHQRQLLIEQAGALLIASALVCLVG